MGRLKMKLILQDLSCNRISTSILSILFLPYAAVENDFICKGNYRFFKWQTIFQFQDYIGGRVDSEETHAEEETLWIHLNLWCFRTADFCEQKFIVVFCFNCFIGFETPLGSSQPLKGTPITIYHVKYRSTIQLTCSEWFVSNLPCILSQSQ